ncbi:MAG: transglycosylase domain-containing protein [Patescibacteria group bacterium]
MARGARKKPDVILAQKKVTSALRLITGLLVFVGKPFYFFLSRLIIALLFLAYLIGHAVRISVTKLLTTKLPKPRIKPRKIKFPPPETYLKILLLKIRLFLIRSFGRVSLKPLTFFVFVLFLIFLFWFLILKDLPSPKTLVSRDQEVSTKIYDRNGVLLYKIYKDKNRTLVALSQIPLPVRLATLAAEDAEFYSHAGFSVRGIMRAIVRNLVRGEVSGGSTITQQLVKNALLSSEKTIIRKVREIILSIGVELTFSKDEILEMYLNEVSYGGTAYGIQEASRVYFGKDVQELSLAEAALLAGLPKSPTKYSPFGANPELAFSRQREVLRLMRVNRYISDEQESQALSQTLTFAPNRTEIKAPHFVMYVRQILADKYGEEVLEKGGLEVVTTLDYAIQSLAEKVVKEEVEKLAALGVGNGAALVINPGSGEILAMVGSKDYFDTAHDGNVNVVVRPRQPGSSIKVVNYAYALSHDYTPATILDDTPVTFSVPGQPPYSPKNYDGTYRGKLPLRSALAESRNVPAVKVLASYGVSRMIELGKKMGITTWEDTNRFGLSLTLGGGEVKLIDLARAYATVANYGRRPEIVSILKVTNYQGKILEEYKCGQNNCEQESVIDPRVAYLLIDIFKDNNARAPAFGQSSYLVIPKHPEVAVKTGTSNDLKDNLTLGFNQKYLVATWVGNNDSSPMSRIASGVTGASPIWNKIMSALLAKEENNEWEVPEGLTKITICPLTGTLPCEGCGGKSEWFLTEKVPQKACLPGQILEPAASTQFPF